VRVDCQGGHGHDGGAILVDFQGNRALAQEEPPRSLLTGVFLLCVWSRLMLTQLLLLLFSSLNSKRCFQDGRSCTSVTPIVHRLASCPMTPPHTAVAAPSAASKIDPQLFVAASGALGGTSAKGIKVGDVGGADVIGVGGTKTTGARGTGLERR
jgi:hypothetical protein